MKQVCRIATILSFLESLLIYSIGFKVFNPTKQYYVSTVDLRMKFCDRYFHGDSCAKVPKEKRGWETGLQSLGCFYHFHYYIVNVYQLLITCSEVKDLKSKF